MESVQQKVVDQAANDNPDLPHEFVRDLLLVLADPKLEVKPFYNHAKERAKDEP
jgi:hypothetical protein